MNHPILNLVASSHIYQYIAKLNRWTSGKAPILDTVIRLCGYGGLVFSLTQLWRRIWYTVYHKFKKYPPGPIGYPVFGCFFSMINIPGFHLWIGSSYYPISMYPVGPKNYEVMISDINLVNKLFKLQSFSQRPSNISPDHGVPSHFGMINGKEWSNRRKLFYNSILKITDSEFMTKYVQNNLKNKIIIPSIERAIKNNDGLWNPKEACFHYTFSTIFGASFGPDLVLNADDSVYNEFQKITQSLFSKAMWYFILPIFSDTAAKMFHKKVKAESLRSREILLKWMQNMDADHKGSDESYIDMMMEANIDREVAISDINSIFQVGTHTTAESIQLMIYTLAKEPKVQSKIYDELRQIFGVSDDINIVDPKLLNKAHYLRAFVEETFRLKAAAGLPRVLTEDFRVDFEDKNGKKDYYILPKGCSVNFNNAHMLRTADNGWKNGNEWNIQNYLDDNDKFVRTKKDFDDRFKLSVFGNGRRICPGISLARREVMFALAILVYKYEFCGPNGKGDTDFVIPPGLLQGPSTSIPIKVIKRE